MKKLKLKEVRYFNKTIVQNVPSSTMKYLQKRKIKDFAMNFTVFRDW